MASKIIYLPEVGQVTLIKRRNSRSLRLSVGHEGNIRVSMPIWTPFKVGESFAYSQIAWLKQQKQKNQTAIIRHGDKVGKAHRVELVSSATQTISTRVSETIVRVSLPFNVNHDHPSVQKAIQKASVRALKHEASQLLPQRLDQLAREHGFDYASVEIKQLKTRWGSCGPKKDIVLNCYLVQLPWDLIDYVLLHELMHTKIMAHGPRFWAALDGHVSNLKEKRKQIRIHRPRLYAAGIN